MTEQKDKCPKCKGAKRVVIDEGVGLFTTGDCPVCNGTGVKKLDSPDREKIERILCSEMITIGLDVDDAKTGQMWAYDSERLSKRIIALFPDIEEAKELNQLFDMRHEADMRATKRWRESHPGKELILPDHADLVCFLMDGREEAKQVAFNKGVKRGTTIRNINWCSENHERHGRKMVKAREEAKTQERERIKEWGSEICEEHNKPTLRRCCHECWQALKEENAK